MNCISNFFIQPALNGVAYCKKAGKNYSKGQYKKMALYLLAGATFITPVLGQIASLFKHLYYDHKKQELSLAITSGSQDCSWFVNYDISFFFRLMSERYPALLAPHIHHQSVTPSTAAEKFEQVFPRKKDTKTEYDVSKAEYIAFYAYLGKSHWGLIFIDRKQKTVEYYDSKYDYEDSEKFQPILQSLAKDLGYTYIRKIQKKLQKDGYQCGPWTCYFLEKRLKDPAFDFNSLDPDKSSIMIANYRESIKKSMKAFQEEIIAKRKSMQGALLEGADLSF